MSAKVKQKITPFLWYAKDAEEAARFYASIFPDSRVDRVTAMPADSPSGPAGSVDGGRVHAVRPAVHGDERRPARSVQPRHLLRREL